MRRLFFFLSRLFLSGFFLITGIGYLFQWESAEQSLINALYSISEHSVGLDGVVQAVEKILPIVPLLLMGAVALLIIGSGLVLLGIRVRLGAFLLIIFLIPTTVIMHHFWALQGLEYMSEMDLFFKNIALLGGLILLMLFPKERGSMAPLGNDN